MRILFALILGASFLAGCTKGADEGTLRFECEDQFQGAACLKLGERREGEEALKYFRLGCEKQSTKSCIVLAERTSDKEEAQRVLKQACAWKSEEACAKAQAGEKK
jgi:hypothetical protein